MEIKPLVFKASLLATAIAMTGCGGDSSSSSSSGSGDTPREVETGTPVSGFSINAQGGEGAVGNGGAGGEIEIIKIGGAAPLVVQKEGLVDTTFTLPEQTANFGTNGITISQAEPVVLVLNDALPLAGTLYMVPDKKRLYRSNGAGAVATDDQEVTGILIEEAGSLTFPDAVNPDRESNDQDSTKVEIFVRNDIQNDGVIQTAYQVENPTTDEPIRSPFAIDIELTSAAYYGSGSINAAGNDNLYRGQKGGDISINAYTIKNSGFFNVSGADAKNENVEDGSDNGGDAGSIELNAEIFVENTGELRANGGLPDEFSGGENGQIILSALEVYNAGPINSNDASTRYSEGELRLAAVPVRDGASIQLAAGRTLINTAALTSNGGDSIGNAIDGETVEATDGGYISLHLDRNRSEFNTLDGKLVNTGDLTVLGGDVTGKSNEDAGDGGEIFIGVSEIDGDEVYSQTTVTISGNLIVKGGDTKIVNYNKHEGEDDAAPVYEAGQGGQGGDISIEVENAPSSNVSVQLVGYDSVNVSGGQGMSGAEAGDILIVSRDSGDRHLVVPSLAGPLSVNTDLFADGGNALAEEVAPGTGADQTGFGGEAGDINLRVASQEAYLQPELLTVNLTGNVSANGGRAYDELSKDGAAHGGQLFVSAPHGISLVNEVNLNGGSDEHQAEDGDEGNHEGGNGGETSLVSQYTNVVIDSTLNANGGDGTLKGGDAGGAYFLGKTAVDVAGTISLNGGNAAASDVDAFSNTEGGDAGGVMLLSGAYNSQLTATIAAAAGAGDSPGESQVVYVDADCQSDNCGVSPEEAEEER